MDQENEHQNDINQQVRDVENLPVIQDAFTAIENLRGASFTNPERNVDEYSENNSEKESSDANEDDQENHSQEVVNDSVNSSKDKKTDKYRKLQNDKYRALAEKEEALRRAAELEEMLKESLNSGTYHYSKNAYSELDKAKEEKRRAFEDGDIDAYLNADIALINSINAINDLEKWAKNNEETGRTQPVNSYVDNDYSEVHDEIAKDWMGFHPYLQPNSTSYNPQLAVNVTEFINELDHNLHRNNESNAIFSDQYFDTIDNYISSLNKPRRNNSANIESFSNVSGVRNSSFSNNTVNNAPTNRVMLTGDEKLMADNAGISHKDWLKYKLKDTKNSNVNRY